MNRIPSTLDRPFLRDAIVEFRFRTTVAEGFLPGIFFERLRDEGWTAPHSSLGQVINLGFQVSVGASPVPTLRKDGIKLQLYPDRIDFNILDAYPGWEAHYYPLIRRTVETLFVDDSIALVQVGLRFINLLPVPDLFELTDRFVSVPFGKYQPLNHTVSWQLKHGAARIIINLTNRVDEGTSSVLDVDIHCSLAEETTRNTDALAVIDDFHRINKEIVFGYLLPEEFVATFGPRY